MKHIDLHNYEAFLLDFLEGALSLQDQDALRHFIAKHPDLEIDLENIFLPSFEKEEMRIDFKHSLKKTVADGESEELLNYLEHHLSEEKQELLRFKLLSRSDLRNELALLKKTILPLESDLVFEHKSALYKTEEDFILNDLVLGYYEKMLSAIDLDLFETELKTSVELEEEVHLVSRTRIEPDRTITYPDKDNLRKKGRIIPFFTIRRVSALAASLLFIAALSFIIQFYTGIRKEQTNRSQNAGFGIHKIEGQTRKAGFQKADPLLSEMPKPERGTRRGSGRNKALVSRAQSGHPGSVLKQRAKTINRGREDTIQANPFVDLPLTATQPEPLNPASALPATVAVENESVQPEDLKSEMPNSLTDPLKTTEYQALADGDSRGFSEMLHPVTVLTVVEDVGEETDLRSAPSRNNFWKQAVKLAKKANKLGVKSIDGDETTQQNFSLSFNSFGIEKK